MLTLLFLSSGLFLGWSLGGNDAANVFGTAVGTRMIRFRTAAWIASVFVVLGAVLGGAGAAHTLGALGAVDALAGAFVVASAAALTVFGMSKAGLPVSTSQAIVGAIIGWNVFGGYHTDPGVLGKSAGTWVLCPLLAAVIGAGLYALYRALMPRLRLHLFRQDVFLRTALVVVGAFGAYSLGANNIANVMGVFVPMAPVDAVPLGFGFALDGVQQLFLLGSLAIAVGIATFSKRVMLTVGSGLLDLSPHAALIAVLANALVLFLFSSVSLEAWLLAHGLPALPLVPVSSTQAVVGAVIGIGLLRRGRGIRFRVLGEIALGWVSTPVVAGVVAFFALFFLQNTFDQEVRRPATFEIDASTLEHLEEQEYPVGALEELAGHRFVRESALLDALSGVGGLSAEERVFVARAAEIGPFEVNLAELDARGLLDELGSEQRAALEALHGRRYRHAFELMRALELGSNTWVLPEEIRETRVERRALSALRARLLRVARMNSPG